MKKSIVVIVLILLGIALHADSVWTGNAAVGGVSEFPGASDVYRAASNSFPAGTILEVTNPKGGKSTFVTVIGRLESPGVFILIESNAAEEIDLPSDHVLPVRVSPVESAEDAEDPVVHGGAVTDDADYNPAAGLEDGPLEPRTAVVPVEEPIEDSAGEAADEEVFVTPVPALVESGEEAVDEAIVAVAEDIPELEIPEDLEAEAEPETIITYVFNGETEEAPPVAEAEAEDDGRGDVPEYTEEFTHDSGDTGEGVTPVEPAEEEGTVGDDEGKGGGKVYFLTPSDLRPPPAIEDDGEEIVEGTGTGGEEAAVEDADLPLDIRLVSAIPGEGNSYIQIGAYESRSILEETARRAQTGGLPYPLSIASGESGGRTIYKLLIGPLRPAEKGVVLRTLRSSAYPDAFPFEP